MSSLRQVTKQRSLDELEKSYFSAANFLVAFPDGDEVEILVEFIPNRDFQFSVSRPGRRFRTNEAPGEHLLTGETTDREDINECLYAIGQWVTRIEEEYRAASPVVDDFERFRESMMAQFREHVADEHLHFTAEEAAGLSQSIDDLKERVSTLAERADGLEQRLAQALQELDSLKPDLQALPRGAWYRKAGSKTLAAIKAVVSSKEAREFALEAAKKLLLPGPK